MKRIALIVLVSLLGACFPAFNDSAVAVDTVLPPWTHGYSTTASGVFVASSTQEITAFNGPNCAVRDTRINGPRTALICDAPGAYRLTTKGTVNAGLLR
ncbi:MAG: hypothetical protein N2045_13665 [Fimbriimonadales bacterium]|nr:hypothetical protein [Fimbriimonadales bacterium]